MPTPDLTDRLAAALADAAGLGDARQVPHEDRVIRWRGLLAEHADRSMAEGWEQEANRLDQEAATRPVRRAASHWDAGFRAAFMPDVTITEETA